MQRRIIREKVKSILAKTINTLSISDISNQSKLKDDLGLDSMSSLTFLMALEDDIDGFLVDPDTLDTSHLEDVESISEYVESQMQRKLQNVA